MGANSEPSGRVRLSTQTEILNFERSDGRRSAICLAGVKTFFACAIVVAPQYTSALFSPSAQNMYVPMPAAKNDFPFFLATRIYASRNRRFLVFFVTQPKIELNANACQGSSFSF